VSAPTRPVLRYYGGKWRLAPWIISHFPPHRVYVEPYGGAASVLLRKPRSYAEIYNDLDGEVVNVFRVLRDPVQARELERLLRLTLFARAEFALAYEESDDPVERARRCIVRAFMGFGSGAVNRTFRTSFRSRCMRPRYHPATDDWRNYPSIIPMFTERLQGVVIEARPALDVIAKQDDSDVLFYVDPPYPASERNTASGGYVVEMLDDDQHRELASVLRAARGMVVISGYPCVLYDEELYPDWQRVERPAFADGARRRTEVLWLSPGASRRLSGMMLFPPTPPEREGRML